MYLPICLLEDRELLSSVFLLHMPGASYLGSHVLAHLQSLSVGKNLDAGFQVIRIAHL